MFERLNAEASLVSAGGSESSSPPVDERHIFYQAISGRNRKRRVYGLRSQARQSYPIGSDSSSSGSYGVLSELEQMRLTVARMNDELNASRIEVTEVRNENVQLRETLQHVMEMQ